MTSFLQNLKANLKLTCADIQKKIGDSHSKRSRNLNLLQSLEDTLRYIFRKFYENCQKTVEVGEFFQRTFQLNSGRFKKNIYCKIRYLAN